MDPRELVDLVAAARLVCFPTDTVYGVGGVATPVVREALLAAKRRDAAKPLQLIYSSRRLLEVSLELGPHVLEAVRRLLPGPLTLLVPYPPGLTFPPPGEVRHGLPGPPGARECRVATLGVRAPAWPATAQALAGLPFPLLASSANPSGGRAPRSVDEVEAGLLAACDLVLDAGPVSGTASTIVDLSLFETERSWRILRPGAVDGRDVAAVLDGDREESQG